MQDLGTIAVTNEKLERVDQYGRPAKWFMDYDPAYLDALVADLKSIELIFQVEFGLQIFLTYGTLLGAIREGDLIGHDSDIDVSYISQANSAEGILAERARIFALFDQAGRVAGHPTHGRFMMLSVPSPLGGYDHGIEVFTSFLRGDRYFGYTSAPGTLPANAFSPLRSAKLRGVEFQVPGKAEDVLDVLIAPDWRIPRLPKDFADPARKHACFDFLYPKVDRSKPNAAS